MNAASAMTQIRIIVTGGGTGGHLFPGIAVAKELRHKIGDCQIMFIGTDRHIDRNSLDREEFIVRSLRCSGLKGMGLGKRLRTGLRLPFAVLEAMKLIRDFKPQLVIGVGGYVTGPVLLAARLLKIPSCIHEQNSVPGLANRLSGRLVDKIFLSLPSSHGFPKHKSVLTGNPVRTEILAAALERTEKRSTEPLTIVILGGSQGAHRLNQLVLEAAEFLTASSPNRLRFVHQTGIKDKELVAQTYHRLGIDAVCEDFFPDMAGVYAKADLAISRAGATTLAELSVSGIPAILVPYPYAADNHQELNGTYYVHGGGALLYRESELNGNMLAQQVLSLLNNPEKLRTMGDTMKTLGKPEASSEIVSHCLHLIGLPDIAPQHHGI
ncbi:MAG: undecaprenyldiphospho-muramoylpentapeptide beta-N-acetylglucosaminyltransferase [Desulfobulbaceae bacterium]|nr:undecaprenyldiphospho-muramoylpentapeptide beta-N-acetylglucosaminyltransferase [Desulfobulbaceae bacterium]